VIEATGAVRVHRTCRAFVSTIIHSALITRSFDQITRRVDAPSGDAVQCPGRTLVGVGAHRRKNVAACTGITSAFNRYLTARQTAQLRDRLKAEIVLSEVRAPGAVDTCRAARASEIRHR